jgi:hypothetical protein
VVLYFGNGRLISVKLVAASLEDARLALTQRYGPPSQVPVPDAATGGTVHAHWTFEGGGRISIYETAGHGVIVSYVAPVWDDARNY